MTTEISEAAEQLIQYRDWRAEQRDKREREREERRERAELRARKDIGAVRYWYGHLDDLALTADELAICAFIHRGAGNPVALPNGGKWLSGRGTIGDAATLGTVAPMAAWEGAVAKGLIRLNIKFVIDGEPFIAVEAKTKARRGRGGRR